MNARVVVTLATFFLAAPLGAATVAPPHDLGALALASDTVVLAHAESSHGEWTGLVPQTVTRFRTLEPVRGAAVRDWFDVVEIGGRSGDLVFVAPGVPHYVTGRDYLLFLRHRKGEDSRWGSIVLSYGLLQLDRSGQVLEPVPEASQLSLVGERAVVPVVRYNAQALISMLERLDVGVPFQQEAVALDGTKKRDLPEFGPPDCKQLVWGSAGGGDDLPVRWFGFETGATTSIIATTPGQVGIGDGGSSAVADGVAAWAGYPDAVIGGLYSGSAPWSGSCGGGSGVTPGEVVFNDPCSDITDLVSCVGTLAVGGAFFATATTPYDGISWHSASAQYVIVNNDSACIGATDFKEMMTHEIGHTYGFGHHTDPDATMYAFCCHSGRGAAIADTDRTCASFQYHTFLDVPYSYWAWAYIEAIQDEGVTVGCGGGMYCPEASVSREQMAVFLLKSKEGSGYVPPACTTPPFSDVPCASPFAPWIAELAARGITAGCGGGMYCPSDPVSREQMAVFLLKTKEGSGFTPPACVTPTFSDVPCASPFAPWVEELVDRAITAGCGGGMYCPGAANSRAQMGVFLTKTFTFPLP